MRPNWWRVTVGLSLAPAGASLVFSTIIWVSLGPHDFGFLLGLYLFVVVIFGYLPALLVGLPAMLFMTRWLRLTILNCTFGGALVALLPLAMVMIAGGRGDPLIHVISGLWIKLKLIGLVAVYGFLDGMIFWLIAEFDIQRLRLSALAAPAKT
jgi:hypothetical protein